MESKSQFYKEFGVLNIDAEPPMDIRDMWKQVGMILRDLPAVVLSLL